MNTFLTTFIDFALKLKLFFLRNKITSLICIFLLISNMYSSFNKKLHFNYILNAKVIDIEEDGSLYFEIEAKKENKKQIKIYLENINIPYPFSERNRKIREHFYLRLTNILNEYEKLIDVEIISTNIFGKKYAIIYQNNQNINNRILKDLNNFISNLR